METQILGKTGLRVSRLGIGLSELGGLGLEEEARASEILNTALDRGITFLDTSACYGNSEELIGRTVAQRRDEFVLATKAGHVTGGYEGEEWTAKTVRDSIDRSLQRLRTDHLDIVQLHTCGIDVLERGEVIEVLQEARGAGKTRFIGYSGDNEPALWAVKSGLFDTLQTTFNLVDQNARRHLFDPAKEQGMGIIAKRPIANAIWGAEKARDSYSSDYFTRAERMASLGPLAEAPDDGVLLALGFCLAHDAVDTAIAGTRNPDHLRQNLEWMSERLPLQASVVEELHRRFEQFADDHDWRQRS